MLTNTKLGGAVAIAIAASLTACGPRPGVLPVDPVQVIEVEVNVDNGTISVSPDPAKICWDEDADSADNADSGKCGNTSTNPKAYPWQVTWKVTYTSAHNYCSVATECKTVVVQKKPGWVNGGIYPKATALLNSGANAQGKPRPPVNTTKWTKRDYRYGLQALCFSSADWCRKKGGVIAVKDPDIMPHGPN